LHPLDRRVISCFDFCMLQAAVCGGFVDRAHDLLLCGIDPYAENLDVFLSTLSDLDDGSCFEHVRALLNMASWAWKPSLHAYLFGHRFQVCIASLCLVKVMAKEDR
jgi:hypothetical protein